MGIGSSSGSSSGGTGAGTGVGTGTGLGRSSGSSSSSSGGTGTGAGMDVHCSALEAFLREEFLDKAPFLRALPDAYPYGPSTLLDPANDPSAPASHPPCPSHPSHPSADPACTGQGQGLRGQGRVLGPVEIDALCLGREQDIAGGGTWRSGAAFVPAAAATTASAPTSSTPLSTIPTATPTPTPLPPVRLAAIFVYPVKSCAGMRVSAWPLCPSGLLYDRGWAVVDSRGRAVTQKSHPRLALVEPRIDL
ncbi:hypothetical protein B484DRAFT_405949, partial [Ochromonadaceae sp. CCMP2298]